MTHWAFGEIPLPPGIGGVPVIAAVLLGTAAPALGADRPIQELFHTETVYAQERHEFQVTLAPLFPLGDGANWFRMPVSFEYGITDSWQFGFAVNELARRREQGREPVDPGEMELSVKRSFMNVRGSRTHLALGFEVELPTGTQPAERKAEGIEYSPFLVVARDLRAHEAQLFAQARLNLGDRSTPAEELERHGRGGTQLGAGGFFKLAWFRQTNEVNWIHERSRLRAADQIYWTPGVVWRLPTRQIWEVAFGVSVGLTGRSDAFTWLVKFTREFERGPVPR